MVRHIFSPSPDPCLNSSNFLKRSNTLSILSAGMPGPVSLTENVILSGYSVSEQCRWISPFSVCFSALVRKLISREYEPAHFVAMAGSQVHGVFAAFQCGKVKNIVDKRGEQFGVVLDERAEF